jgi:hypothetical protein
MSLSVKNTNDVLYLKSKKKRNKTLSIDIDELTRKGYLYD